MTVSAARGQAVATVNLNKYADPIEDARLGLSIGEARDIAAEDPGLIYLDTYPSDLTLPE